VQKKQCSKCGVAKDSSLFHANWKSSDGKMSCCKECSKLKTNMWRSRNRERWAAYVKDRQNRPDIKARRNALRAIKERTAREAGQAVAPTRDSEARRLWRKLYEASYKVKAYRKAYKARLNRIARDRELRFRPLAKMKHAAYVRAKRRLDPKFALDSRMYVAIRQSLKTGRMGKTWKRMVPYSLDELKSHIESHFVRGMSWENRNDWHIDHIVPISAFNFSSPEDEEFKKCWDLSNLRPLWWKENLTKGNKLPDGSRPKRRAARGGGRKPHVAATMGGRV